MYADHNRLFYSPLDPDISKLQLLTVLDLAYNQLEYVRDVCMCMCTRACVPCLSLWLSLTR
jgi:hypothetical protein